MKPGETLGQRLVALMKQAKVKNVDLAKAVGVAPETVAYWRNNTQALQGDNLEAVVAYLVKHGVDTTRGYIAFGDIPGRSPGTPEEVDSVVNDVIRLVTHRDARESEGASLAEINRLNDRIAAALQSLMEASVGNTALAFNAARAIGGLMSSKGTSYAKKKVNGIKRAASGDPARRRRP